jgi:anti-anti-sigma regulatory factor
MKTTSLAVLHRKGPITIASLQTASLMDQPQWQSLLDTIQRVIRTTEVVHLLLDFRHVKHISLEFFGDMKRLNEENGGSGGTMCICGLQKPTLEILKSTSICRVPHTGASVDHALRWYLQYLKCNGYTWSSEKAHANG